MILPPLLAEIAWLLSWTAAAWHFPKLRGQVLTWGLTAGVLGTAVPAAVDVRLGGLMWLAAAGLGGWAVMKTPPWRALVGSLEARSAALLGLGILTWVAMEDAFPRGWDPWFHVLLADKIRTQGAWSGDWEPWDAVGLNYPQGLHSILAVMGIASSAPAPVVFATMWVVVAACAMGQLVTFARRMAGDDAAWWTAAAAAGGSWAAIVGCVAWGGLPNLLALGLLAGLLTSLQENPSRGRLIGESLILVALSLVHHHVMLAAGVVLLALSGGGRTRRLLTILMLAAALGSPYFIPLLVRAPTVGATNMAHYFDPPLPLIPALGTLGWPVVMALLGALTLALRGRLPSVLAPAVWRPPLALLGTFAICDGPVRAWLLETRGLQVSPLTAIRFLIDASYLLCVPAGAFVSRALNGQRPRWISAATVLLATGALAMQVAQHPSEGPFDGRLEAYRWIQSHTPTDAIILDDAPWATYFSQRVSSGLPLPASEPQSESKAIMAMIRDGRLPPPPGRLVLRVQGPSHPAREGEPVVWRSEDGWRIQRVPGAP